MIMIHATIIVGYVSALEYWRAAGPKLLRGKRQRREDTLRAREALACGTKPKLALDNRRPAGVRLPLHALVGDARHRTRTASVTTSIWKTIPDRSMADAGMGFIVSTPEFCFLQMAGRLTLVQLMLLGFELCGTYAVVEQGPAQRREAPLTSVDKLRSFVEAAAGAPGRAKALRALRYVRDGAASPMESALTLLLCLPYALGGYGLPYPQLNYHVSVPSTKRKLADRTYCVCDLCWPETSFCIEYDSELHHADAEKQESDARRRNTLIAMGFTVATVSRGQVMDSGAFNRLAQQIAKRVGKRLRYRDPQFTRNHLAVREELWSALFPKR